MKSSKTSAAVTTATSSCSLVTRARTSTGAGTLYVLSKERVEGAEPAIKTIKPLGLEGLGAKHCDAINLKACITEVVARDDAS